MRIDIFCPSLHSLAGDYSGDNSVGQEDYDLWVANFGSITNLAADGNGNGVIDAADYTTWRDNDGAIRTPAPFLNLVVDTLGEAEEAVPGAIIFRNSDFSKEVLDASQPELGLPLYVPDHLVASNVYDTNAAEDFTTGSIRIDPSMLGSHTVSFTFSSDVRIWTTTQWAGMTSVGGGRYQISSGTILTPSSVHLDFQIEGLSSSAGFGTQSLIVESAPTGGGIVLSDSVAYTVVDTAIGVDGNRDTQIDFSSSYDRQLLFWFNNDQEGDHPTDDQYEFEDTLITSTDGSDNFISGERDLEDFAPLRVFVDPLLIQNTYTVGEVNPPDPSDIQVTYNLLLSESEGVELRLFNSISDDANVVDHLSDVVQASIQVNSNNFRQSVAASSTTVIPLGELNFAGSNSYLFEAIGRVLGSTSSVDPTLELEILVEYGGGKNTRHTQKIDLDLRDIRSLYTRWDVDYGANFGQAGIDDRFDPDFMHFPTPTTPTHQSEVVDTPFWSGDDTVIFVHGWNNSDRPGMDDKGATSDTMFKRLYWQGFRGEYVAFNWPTLVDAEAGIDFFGLFGETLASLALSYNPSEFNAFRSGKALKEVLASYRDAGGDLNPVHLVAHSMGNVVAGEALKIWADNFNNLDPLVTNYIAMQGAVSSGAWGDNAKDSDEVEAPFFQRPTPDLYRFWSHGRDGINNASLGVLEFWDGASFSAENMINYYNEEDYALSWWDYNNDSKEFGIESTIWGLDYDLDLGSGIQFEDDEYTRVDDNPNPDILTPLTIVAPQNVPNDLRDLGANAYEIVAFFSTAASRAIGMKAVDFQFSPWDVNVDVTQIDSGLLGGNGILINHSYQFGHDIAETWPFWLEFMSSAGLSSTRNVVGGPANLLGDALASPALIGMLPLPQSQGKDEATSFVSAALNGDTSEYDRLQRNLLIATDRVYADFGSKLIGLEEDFWGIERKGPDSEELLVLAISELSWKLL